ncbi:MAG TPA: adenine phosphoribosyltransferase [Firmicutes bacterium]|nr:adenine phosphoribosyltransferase [Bacillota bacterium]
MELRNLIREVPDFPKPGINFKDITPILADGRALRQVIGEMADHFRKARIERVVGVESRGFLFGAPLAYELGCGFALVRKPGKLPCTVERVEYALEYGTDALEIHRDAVEPGQRVLMVDDLLATGGTIGAAMDLVQRLGGEIVGAAFVIELSFLGGREKLSDRGVSDILALVSYDAE